MVILFCLLETTPFPIHSREKIETRAKKKASKTLKYASNKQVLNRFFVCHLPSIARKKKKTIPCAFLCMPSFAVCGIPHVLFGISPFNALHLFICGNVHRSLGNKDPYNKIKSACRGRVYLCPRPRLWFHQWTMCRGELSEYTVVNLVGGNNPCQVKSDNRVQMK